MEREARYGAPPANDRLEAFLSQMMDESAVLPKGSPARNLIEAGVVEVRLLQRLNEQMQRNLSTLRSELDSPARLVRRGQIMNVALEVVDAVLAARDAKAEYHRLEYSGAPLDLTEPTAKAKVDMRRAALAEAALRMEAACSVAPLEVLP